MRELGFTMGRCRTPREPITRSAVTTVVVGSTATTSSIGVMNSFTAVASTSTVRAVVVSSGSLTHHSSSWSSVQLSPLR